MLGFKAEPMMHIAAQETFHSITKKSNNDWAAKYPEFEAWCKAGKGAKPAESSSSDDD